LSGVAREKKIKSPVTKRMKNDVILLPASRPPPSSYLVVGTGPSVSFVVLLTDHYTKRRMLGYGRKSMASGNN
jgi:hypothetical protein